MDRIERSFAVVTLTSFIVFVGAMTLLMAS